MAYILYNLGVDYARGHCHDFLRDGTSNKSSVPTSARSQGRQGEGRKGTAEATKSTKDERGMTGQARVRVTPRYGSEMGS